jgi:Domain of unknown function (DUF6456)
LAKKPSRKTRDQALLLGRDRDTPPPERARHDPLSLVDEIGPGGITVSHYRVADAIVRLERIGLIERECASAGERFRRDFLAAQLDPLSAADLRRSRGAGGQAHILDRAEDARERLWRAVCHLGSISSPAGSIIWHVVGAEMSLQHWALRQGWGAGRPIRHEVATGILIGALGALAGYYGGPVRRGPAPRRPGAVAESQSRVTV